MSRRDRIRMSEQEVADFLDGQRTVHVATAGHDGWPHLTTLWYGLVDGRIAFWTYAASQKVKNLERDDRVTALVEAGDAYAELRGVQIRGRARLSRSPDEVMRVAEAVYGRNADRFGAVRYQGREMSEGGGPPDQAHDDATRELLAQMSAKRIAIVVEPEHVVTWDHRKLGGVY